MGLFAEDPSLVTSTSNILYQTAVVLAILRWVFSLILELRARNSSGSSTEESSSDDVVSSCSASSSPSLSAQRIRDNLGVARFEEVKDRSGFCVSDTCAVCLSQLKERDEVRELRNCCHVFHRECIDRWVEYDHDRNHRTCPLCRAPLVGSAQCLDWPRNEPSWAVDRLLYLFGDDLLP